jgi:hypothetical protein
LKVPIFEIRPERNPQAKRMGTLANNQQIHGGGGAFDTVRRGKAASSWKTLGETGKRG